MVGQTIGKYRIVDRLGRGGMGTVYRAVDETLHREVAIKVLNAELNDPDISRRFRAEAVAIARLNHPGIALIYELVQHEGQWLMVIEYVRGETLESLVARSGPLPTPQAAELAIQVLAALAHAHSMGVVHRDLKPPNIMITETGATKIMDFGIARVAGTEHLTSAGLLMGTPAYMAPEQVMGGEIDARTDLFSVGVVLYHLLTGKLPFKGETPMAMVQSRIRDLPTPIRAIRQDLPAWISIVMERALERAADRRFQSADEMRDALRRGLSGLPVEVPGPLLTAAGVDCDGAAREPDLGAASICPAQPDPRRLRHTDRHRVADAFRPVGICGLDGRAGHRPAGSGLAGPASRRWPSGFFRTGAGERVVKDPARAKLAAIAAGVVALLIGGTLVVRFMRDAPQAAPSVTPPPSTTAAPAPVEPPPPVRSGGPGHSGRDRHAAAGKRRAVCEPRYASGRSTAIAAPGNGRRARHARPSWHTRWHLAWRRHREGSGLADATDWRAAGPVTRADANGTRPWLARRPHASRHSDRHGRQVRRHQAPRGRRSHRH